LFFHIQLAHRYSTGGIRCDVYSTVLKEQGYDNVFTLEGGVQAYFEEFGTKEEQRWDDQLFVVGLYRLRIQFTHSLKAPGFIQPLSL
jgi:predicted sulfurtransferase